MSRILLVSLAWILIAGHPVLAGEVVWSDGDSGRIDGQRFRLKDVDAPETAAVGARGGAHCEVERVRGRRAAAYMRSLTDGRDDVDVSKIYGRDRFGRLLVSLMLDGVDLAESGIEAGVLRRWPHAKGRALLPKPDWCFDF